MKSPKEQYEILTRHAVDIIPKTGLMEKLALERPLIVKLGIDPTSPDLHLGHTVVLNQCRLFQTLGHKVVLLIGNFTALIGDPSGKNTTRPVLTSEAITAHTQTYLDQVGHILSLEDTTVVRNDDWYHKLSAADLLTLISSQTIAQLLERDDFAKRYQKNAPIAMHELIYPILQGYDSVEIKADIELGGTDQTFNLLMGRAQQKTHNLAPQVAMTMPLLEGLDGVQKMSKSLNNTIDIQDTPEDFYGKTMSISDALMWRYFDLLSTQPLTTIEGWKKEAEDGTTNPRDIKCRLAHELVARYHSSDAADAAETAFLSRFSKKIIPEDCPITPLSIQEESQPIAQILKMAGLVASTSEALRLIKQKAVKVDGTAITENMALSCQTEPYLIQVGKRRLGRILLDQNG